MSDPKPISMQVPAGVKKSPSPAAKLTVPRSTHHPLHRRATGRARISAASVRYSMQPCRRPTDQAQDPLDGGVRR